MHYSSYTVSLATRFFRDIGVLVKRNTPIWDNESLVDTIIT